MLFSKQRFSEVMGTAADLAADPEVAQDNWESKVLLSLHRSWRDSALEPGTLWVAVPETSLVLQGPFVGVFGLNDHASTVLSMRWVRSVCSGLRQPVRMLDYGSGTGLLSFIGAQCLPASSVLHGVDICPEAVRSAQDNAAMNGFAHRVQFFVNKDEPSEYRGEEGYHVVVANILAEPLIKFEPVIAERARAGAVSYTHLTLPTKRIV
eukprot:TRINITY_DN32394_c0_g1_i2.p1 TRINITY_DN32394_c0_g1~~TRINITY_DN32394_c0_g1_i2.p1  ORF type:complete len:208 (+),score=36.13 TRINITY_DN32394_c0_g1_i2:316-939(+)